MGKICPLVADVRNHQASHLDAFVHMAEFCMKPRRRFCLFPVSLANNMGFRHFVIVIVFLRHILLKKSA